MLRSILKVVRLSFFSIATLFVVTNAFGQFTSLHQINGTSGNFQLGTSVASVGDINGDGYSDFIIGAVDAYDGSIGAAFVYSGVDGLLLYQKNGSVTNEHFGFSVASAGDVNGDGKPDFIVGAPDIVYGVGRSAYVCSGADGSLLFQKIGAAGDLFGYSVAGIGDLNGDGSPEFIVGAPGASPNGLGNAGSVYIYSGADGSVLYQKDGIAVQDNLGRSVASVDDLNGDGVPDFIIGAWLASPSGLTRAGSVFAYSGVDGTLLFQKDGTATGDRLGSSVASAGDVNGDGKSDFIIGAKFASGVGSAYVYSGVDGSLLYQVYGNHNGAEMGGAVASAGDVNGDGKADFIVGSCGCNCYGDFGTAFIYSGADGSLLYQKVVNSQYCEFTGLSVASAGDINGDGRADFIFGAPYDSPGDIFHAGSTYVYGLPCPTTKADMNTDGSLTPSDVVLMINCVFLGSGNCALCFADVSCNGILTSSDVVIELNAVFLAEQVICSP